MDKNFVSATSTRGVACRVGVGASGDARAFLGNGDRCIGQHGSGRIGHVTGDLLVEIGLRRQSSGGNDKRENNEGSRIGTWVSPPI
jgi:hypothetical protein